MSQENVDLTYQVTDAFNRRDLDAFLSFLHPDVEHAPLAAEGPYRGHNGVRSWWMELVTDIGDFSAEIQTVRDHGDFVLATVRIRGHGTGSGAPFDQTVWTVTEWRDEKALSWSSHASEAEALEAIGLRE